MSLPHQKSQRCGTIALEVLAAVVLLVIMVTAVVQLAVAIARDRALREQHLTARNEAANLMAAAYALPWDQLSTETADEIPLTDAATENLKGVKSTITVAEAPESDPAALRARVITVEVTWDQPGGRTHSAELTAWRYHRADGEQP